MTQRLGELEHNCFAQRRIRDLEPALAHDALGQLPRVERWTSIPDGSRGAGNEQQARRRGPQIRAL